MNKTSEGKFLTEEQKSTLLHRQHTLGWPQKSTSQNQTNRVIPWIIKLDSIKHMRRPMAEVCIRMTYCCLFGFDWLTFDVTLKCAAHVAMQFRHFIYCCPSCSHLDHLLAFSSVSLLLFTSFLFLAFFWIYAYFCIRDSLEYGMLYIPYFLK